MSITDLEDFEGCGSLPNPTPPPTTNVQWYIKDGTWWLGDYNSGVQAEGEEGLSAYEVAVRNGFVGTEQEWVAGILAGYYHSLIIGNPHDTQIEDIPGLVEAIEQAGKVKTVNGIEPDVNGNIELEFDDLLNKPTTASEYGITDVYTKTEVDANVVHKTGNLAETITGPKTFENGKLITVNSAGGAFNRSLSGSANPYGANPYLVIEIIKDPAWTNPSLWENITLELQLSTRGGGLIDVYGGTIIIGGYVNPNSNFDIKGIYSTVNREINARIGISPTGGHCIILDADWGGNQSNYVLAKLVNMMTNANVLSATINRTDTLTGFTNLQSKPVINAAYRDWVNENKVDKSGDTMTGTLQLTEGTTTVAPTILPEGELLTTPTDGAIERDEDGIYITEGATRKRLATDVDLEKKVNINDGEVVSVVPDITRLIGLLHSEEPTVKDPSRLYIYVD